MGYLPRVLFLNAFQLGTKRKNQVFLGEEASTTPDLRLPFLPLGNA
jgi:hypothetical protein